MVIDPVVLRQYQDDWHCKLGFLIAEKHDFGTWKKINALFNAVLGISRFSKEEGKYFEALPRVRNLLVHHGGVLTTAYVAPQKKTATNDKCLDGRFWDSLVITPRLLRRTS